MADWYEPDNAHDIANADGSGSGSDCDDGDDHSGGGGKGGKASSPSHTGGSRGRGGKKGGRGRTGGRGRGDSGDKDGRGRGAGPPIVVSKDAHVESPEGALLRQWLAVAIQPLQVVSFLDTEATGDQHCISFYQVLDVEQKNIIIRGLPLDQPEVGCFSATLQALTIFVADPSHILATEQASYAVYAVQDPEEVDIVSLIGTGPGARQRIKCYTVDVHPDIEDCLLLTNGTALQVGLPLSSPQMPCLCLLDELLSQGFDAMEGVVHHSATSPLVYDYRKPASKRFYYQFLLCRMQLFLAGVVTFSSNSTAAFFRLMLRLQGLVPEDLSAKQYRERLAALEDEYVLPANPPAPPLGGPPGCEDR